VHLDANVFAVMTVKDLGVAVRLPFDFLNSLVAARAELFDGWYLKYPLLFTGFGVLLFIHAAVAGQVKLIVGRSRKHHTVEGWR
jgi:hypothetical protein